MKDEWAVNFKFAPEKSTKDCTKQTSRGRFFHPTVGKFDHNPIHWSACNRIFKKATIKYTDTRL